MHIYGIQKDGTDEPTCRAGIEGQMLVLQAGLYISLHKRVIP